MYVNEDQRKKSKRNEGLLLQGVCNYSSEGYYYLLIRRNTRARGICGRERCSGGRSVRWKTSCISRIRLQREKSAASLRFLSTNGDLSPRSDGRIGELAEYQPFEAGLSSLQRCLKSGDAPIWLARARDVDDNLSDALDVEMSCRSMEYCLMRIRRKS